MMMRAAPLALLLSGLTCFPAAASAQLAAAPFCPFMNWARAYDPGFPAGALSVQPTADGGFIVAGLAGFTSPFAFNAYVARLDGAGEILWQKGFDGESLGAEARQTRDGGFVVAASIFLDGYYAFVVRLDRLGNVERQRVYQGPGWTEAYDIRETANGGLVVAGTTQPGTVQRGYDAWILKLDAAGNPLWQRIYGGPEDDGADAIRPIPDGGFLVAGTTNSFGAGGADAWLLALDSDGIIKWQKAYGGAGNDSASSLLLTEDGGFLVTGHTSSFGLEGGEPWAIRLEPSGDVVWQMAYAGGAGKIYGAAPAADGGFVLAGRTEALGVDGGADVWVFKIDASGGLLWQRSYGGLPDYFDLGAGIGPTADGGSIIAGETSLSIGFEPVDAKPLLLKLDALGRIDKTCSITRETGAKSVTTTAVATAGGATALLAGVQVRVPILDGAAAGARTIELCAGLFPPGEVSAPGSTGPLLFGDDRTLQWEPAAGSGACTFNLYRGAVTGLSVGGYGECLAPDLPANTATDAAAPAAGGAWFYLVTGENVAGEGPSGNDSGGVPRPNPLPCP